ncbi:hypothetical protein [Fontibacillus sp. BL9]|uniref:hypothetical protein n=1 Tax=Fontibacillus sp. BL9 TaxID=3389971 RepID=UPI00397C1252
MIIMTVALIFAFMEYKQLKKRGNIREIVISASLLGIGLIISAIRISGMKMPSPHLLIRLIEHSLNQVMLILVS